MLILLRALLTLLGFFYHFGSIELELNLIKFQLKFEDGKAGWLVGWIDGHPSNPFHLTNPISKQFQQHATRLQEISGDVENTMITITRIYFA